MDVKIEDLQAVGEDFYLFLNDLTFNSKPIISNLTQIAQENVNAAQYITLAVEKRIEKAPQNHKLFAFYLLDSISKNVGSPYTLLFGQKLFQTFTKAYLLVDDITRKKFIDLFKTWKLAKTSSGLPLFPQEPIDKIEQFLIKASSIYQQSSQQQQNKILISMIDKLLFLTNQRLISSPNDETIKSKIGIINQLKAAIQSENLPQQSLIQVQRQLDDMTRHEEAFLRNTPPVQVKPVITTTPSPGLLNNIVNTKPKSTNKKDLNSLLTNLEKTGLLKKSIPSNSLLKSLINKKPETTNIINKTKSELSQFQLDSKSLSTINPTKTFIKLLYQTKPNKCGSCGKRFGNDDQSSKNRRDHLDWHFRINKKLKENSIVQSKSWYLDDEEFVKFKDFEILGIVSKDEGDYNNYNINNNNDNNNVDSNNEDNNKRQFVIVPNDSNDMNCVCGICKEVLNSKYDDELGEWIWDNAISKNGKIFHLNCFNETNKNSGLLLKNIIGDLKRSNDEVVDDKKSKIMKLDMNLLKNIVSNVKLNDVK